MPSMPVLSPSVARHLVVARGVTLFGNNYGTSQFISVTGNNAAIMGPGTIDGRADLPISGTPRLINAKHITNFTAYNVTLTHSGKMHLYMEDGIGRHRLETHGCYARQTPKTPTVSTSIA